MRFGHPGVLGQSTLIETTTCADPVTRGHNMESDIRPVASALGKRLDGRLLLLITAVLAAACLLAVAGSARLGQHPTTVHLYSTVVSAALRGSGDGGGRTCRAAAVTVPKVRSAMRLRSCLCVLLPIPDSANEHGLYSSVVPRRLPDSLCGFP